jgi:predicted phosphodiesterase
MSDTHSDKSGATPHIIREFKRRGVEVIFHCGDLSKEDLVKGENLYEKLPVTYALVDGQNTDQFFVDNCPKGWQFTRANDRVRQLIDGTWVYIGHKYHLHFLRASETDFNAMLTALREKFDGLRYVFGGHLHFQTYKQGQLISFINPGAMENDVGCGAVGYGYEYAVVDTDTGEIVFSRILPAMDDRPTFSLGIISDSLDISHRDGTYWTRLAKEFKARDVSHIIHCGNLALEDIGRPELADFVAVHYTILNDQVSDHRKLQKSGKIPSYWRVISEENPDDGAIVDISGPGENPYIWRCYVQLDLGLKFKTISEMGMDSMAMQIRRKYPQTEFVLCGFTREGLLVEGQQVTTINPGNVNTDRSFAVICLPRREITFGHVPYSVLPPLTEG